MEEFLDKQTEERLFDLLERSDFEDLNDEERSFVLSHCTEQEYCFQRAIFTQASDLETPELEPKPLLLPVLSKPVKTIPLYQALLAIAAIIILFICCIPWLRDGQMKQTPLVADSDSTRTIVVHDTVLQVQTEIKYVDRITVKRVYESNDQLDATYRDDEPKLLNAPQTLLLPELNKDLLSNRGKSWKDDPDTQFVRPLNLR